MRQLKYFINYGRLVDMIKSWEDILGGSRELFEEVSDAAKRDLEERKGEQVIHGDFWSGKLVYLFFLFLRSLSFSSCMDDSEKPSC